jgi:hypothetical protein
VGVSVERLASSVERRDEASVRVKVRRSREFETPCRAYLHLAVPLLAAPVSARRRPRLVKTFGGGPLRRHTARRAARAGGACAQPKLAQAVVEPEAAAARATAAAALEHARPHLDGGRPRRPRN